MHVQCPSCKITYNVSDNLINSESATFRCSRCRHTFVLEIRRESKSPRKIMSLSPKNLHPNEEERELSFSFIQPEANRRAPEQEAGATLAPGATPDLNRPKEKAQQASDPGSGGSESLLFPPRVENPPAFAPKSDALSGAVETEFEKTWWTPPKQPEEKQPATQLSSTPYLGIFVLLLTLYALFVLNHSSNPEQVEKRLRLIPGMEWMVFKNNHLKQGIEIQSITQKTQMIRGNREVFTISGVVVNRNPVGVREVRIEGYIFNGDGSEMERQMISVGNPISANLIRDVEAKEISILQEIGPQKRFTIPPDESAPFLIVFLKPPKDIKSFAYRVLSAEEAG